MDVVHLQQALTALGHQVDEDGEPGPQTWQALIAEVGRDLPGLGAALAVEFPIAEIDSPLRVSHFLAQAAHETGGFHRLTEPGRRDAFTRYDGRADLGNTERGDGWRYRGRGLLRLTGRSAYLAYGARLEIDLVGHPEKAAEIETAAAIACLFWQYKGLNALADADDCRGVTRKIDGALLRGLAGREGYLARIKRLWGLA